MTQWGLDTLFNPAKRHMDEEKRRLQSTREQIGDNSGGRRIDLESGKVVIRRSDDDESAETEAEAETRPETRRGRRTSPRNKDSARNEDSARSKDSARTDAAARKPAERPEPSAAAIRAAARRKRRPS